MGASSMEEIWYAIGRTEKGKKSISHMWLSILFGGTLLKQRQVMQNDNQGWLAKAAPKFPLKEAYYLATEHVRLETAQSHAWTKIWRFILVADSG